MASVALGISREAWSDCLKMIWADFVQQVSPDNMLDAFLPKNIISLEQYSNIRKNTTQEEKNRELLLTLRTINSVHYEAVISIFMTLRSDFGRQMASFLGVMVSDQLHSSTETSPKQRAPGQDIVPLLMQPATCISNASPMVGSRFLQDNIELEDVLSTTEFSPTTASPNVNCGCHRPWCCFYQDGFICRSCLKEWYSRESVQTSEEPPVCFWGKEYLSPAKMPNNDMHDIMPTSEVLINSQSLANTLRPGDHIVWHRPWLWHHHAIVESVRDAKITLIRFSRHYAKKTSGTDKLPVTSDEVRACKGTWLNGNLYRLDHSREVNYYNPPNIVLARAKALQGKSDLLELETNERFAIFCKTGHLSEHRNGTC